MKLPTQPAWLGSITLPESDQAGADGTIWNNITGSQ
jgi:hypothetical protein